MGVKKKRKRERKKETEDRDETFLHEFKSRVELMLTLFKPRKDQTKAAR